MSGDNPRVARLMPLICSGEENSSQAIYSGECLLAGVKVFTDGTNAATVIVYDNTEASGKVVDKYKITGSENYGGTIYGKAPLIIENGIYVSVSGTGASFIVNYFTYEPSLLHSGYGRW